MGERRSKRVVLEGWEKEVSGKDLQSFVAHVYINEVKKEPWRWLNLRSCLCLKRNGGETQETHCQLNPSPPTFDYGFPISHPNWVKPLPFNHHFYRFGICLLLKSGKCWNRNTLSVYLYILKAFLQIYVQFYTIPCQVVYNMRIKN